MKLLRGGAALLVFLVGLFMFAGGLFSAALTVAAAAQPKRPINLSDLAVGLAVCALGILLLIISRTIDPDHGPVRSYRRRPQKSRTTE